MPTNTSAIFSAYGSVTASEKAYASVKTLADAIALVKKTTKAVDEAKASALEMAANAEACAAKAMREVQMYMLSTGSSEDQDYDVDQVVGASAVTIDATADALNAMRLYAKACDAVIDAKMCLNAAQVNAQVTASAAAKLTRCTNQIVKQAIDLA